MNFIGTSYLERCTQTLDGALKKLSNYKEDELEYAIYRSACIKEFEIILEQASKLLKRCLAPYFASKKQADRLHFKDTFRFATKHDIISFEASERWMTHRDNRNLTAHDYGSGFAEQTLQLLPIFIKDAHWPRKSRNLIDVFEREG